MEIRTVNIPAHNENGKILLDQRALQEVILEEKDNSKKDLEDPVLYRKEVYKNWSDAVSKERKAWQNKNNIIGESLNNDFCFNSEILNYYKERIELLLSLVDKAKKYEELMILNNGKKWTEARQKIDFLISLGNALGLVKVNKETQDVEFNLKRTKK